MKILVNLASQPFRRDRPVMIASVLLGTALTVLLALLVTLSVIDYRDSKSTRAGIARLEQEIRVLNAEQSRLEMIGRRPENAQVLEQNLFLNTLIYRKAISWTRIFTDLEKTVPHNVRVVSIRPWLNPGNEVVLEMSVGTEQTEPMLQLLKRLESAEQFGATSVASSVPPSQTDPLYRYKVNVNYAQKF